MSASGVIKPYRVPPCLRDLVMIDLLEITGSTTATAQMLALSQPTVSRRYRSLVRDLGLQRQRNGPVGQRFANAPWIPPIRRGVNHHRLSAGWLRLGSRHSLHAQWAELPWAQWVHLGQEQQRHWRSLLQLELIDGIAFEQEPGLSENAKQSLTVVPIAASSRSGFHLVCRRDPLVLALAQRDPFLAGESS
jgi:hypothetical protein